MSADKNYDGELRLFRVNDWAFVAARTLEEAKDWHRREYPGEEIDDDWCEEEAIDQPMHDGEVGDTEAPIITMREEIKRQLAAGEIPPFLVATDGHYA